MIKELIAYLSVPPGTIILNFVVGGASLIIGGWLSHQYSLKRAANDRTAQISLKIIDYDTELNKNVDALKLIRQEIAAPGTIKTFLIKGSKNAVNGLSEYLFGLMTMLNIIDYACMLLLDNKLNKDEFLVEFKESLVTYYRAYKYLLQDDLLSKKFGFKKPTFSNFETLIEETKLAEIIEPRTLE